MATLAPMSSQSFDDYMSEAVAGYAEQNIKSGRWLPEEAVFRSHAEHEKLLPQGMSTPDNFFFEVRDAQEDLRVGSLWLGLVEKAGIRTAYVFDIRIGEQYRRRGFARSALESLDSFVRSLGIETIGLHVFAYNNGAQALYESLGYAVTGLNMQKQVPRS